MRNQDYSILIRELKAGKESAFDSLFRLFYQDLCRFACSFLNDPMMAEDVVQGIFDVYQIFDFERYLSEPQERVELHYKLIQQVVKYHKQLELWKKEIESLLPQKGHSAAIDKRILELDSKLEKSIDGHAAIPDEVKNDLKSNKLDELIDKIDLLLKED